MFKFLFGKKGAAKAVIETQRETVTRTVEELNAILALMADKPKIGVDLNTGMLTVDLPEQMPDEALALPAPEEKAAETPAEKVEDAGEAKVEDAKDAVKEAVEDVKDSAAEKAAA